MRHSRWIWGWTVLALFAVASDAGAAYRLADVTVVLEPGSPAITRLAANQVRGYVYQLTGTYPPLAETTPASGPAIVLRTGQAESLPQQGIDPAQNFALYAEHDRQIVHGASGRATLWAAYALIESWDVGFYLGGDAIPPRDPNRSAEYMIAKFQPAFAIRGNVPWFNFLNSPTTWNPQDYKTFFQQMAKQRANLVHFHAYDHEPLCAYDLTDDKAHMGGPFMTTISAERWWSPSAMSTKDHLFGTDLFFSRGEWGSETGIEDAWTYAPGRATRWQQQMIAEALEYAQTLGIHSCVGFEVTGDPADKTNQNVLRKRLQHVLATYPLEYLAIWQSEAKGVSGEEASREKDRASDADELWKAFDYFPDAKHRAEGVRMARYLKLAYHTLKETKPDVRLVVSGWGGDQHLKFTDYYIGLDKLLPPDVVFSALDNMNPRRADHVADAYGKLSAGRERWPVAWFESDGGELTGPQPNVGAFEPVMKDIARKHCQGIMGIHWRTRNVEDVAGYLYRFAWNVELTPKEFIHQYARDQYGPDQAVPMTEVHLQLESYGAQYVGVSGTPECAPRRFSWMNKRKNLQRDRLPILEALAKELRSKTAEALTRGQDHAAIQFHDLAATIEWLVKRAQTGWAAGADTAPLMVELGKAEASFDQGQVAQARSQAKSILNALESCDFRGAMQALASTCRTRGELGMLATCNARYGRYYATVLQRLARILGQPLADSFGWGRWHGEEVLTVFPVPDYVHADQAVWFDAVLLAKANEATLQIALKQLDTPKPAGKQAEITLPFERLNAACYRAVFFPPGEGTWSWRLELCGEYKRPENALPLPQGVVSVTAR